MFSLFLKVLLCMVFGLLQIRAVVEKVSDSYLVQLLTEENSVVALFTKSDCQHCDDLESVVESIQKELKDNIGAVVVKVYNSHMVGLYNPSKEPALVYFRRGVPLLYYGSTNAREIVQVFGENIVPLVKELSDLNFEHMTQSATGATTGDWFIFFYSTDCVLCTRLHATWEAVGSRLKLHLNVARVDRLGLGIATAKRFGIKESPEFLLLRHGKVYRYKNKEYAATNLIEFAEKGFMKQINPQVVPSESNVINTFFTAFIDSVKSSQIWMIPVCVLSAVALGCVIKCVVFNRTAVKHNGEIKKAK